MTIRRPLILGVAKNYGIRELRPFVVSLRQAGYRGDVCFFVDNVSAETLEFLAGHGVQFQPLPARWFTQARRHPVRLLANLAPRAAREAARFELSRYYLHLQDARYPGYLAFLQKTRGLYSHVMFTDVKDVIFQRDPFDFDWRGAFCSFDEPILVRDESHTRGWLEQGYGRAEAGALGARRVICSGVSIAEIDAALVYLQEMCREFVRINARGLIDQGVHNRLLLRNRIPGAHVYAPGESPVVHLGTVPPEKLALNAGGLVVNGSGRVANAVHQYFHHRPALARALEHMGIAGS